MTTSTLDPTAPADAGGLHYVLGAAWDEQSYRFGGISTKEPLARAATIGPDLAAQVREAYRLTLGREPTATESKAVTEYAAKHGLANACRMLLNCNEFAFVN